ncbi:MAG: DUF3025 domain-containing protein [Limnohabitans sp.]|nr:DUF3025 domain-containing protein [Limnohabitans sp.]
MAHGALIQAEFWNTPWFDPWKKWGVPVVHDWAQSGAVEVALNRYRDNVLQEKMHSHQISYPFVAQCQMHDSQAYESFILKHQQIPTRNNYHDYWNGLCWLRFPIIKKRLNQLQAEQIEVNGIGAARGQVRDALTLWDENSVLLQTSDAIWLALTDRNWKKVFITYKEDWKNSHIILFGHALLEKMMSPYKSITAHAVRVDLSNPTDDAEVDTEVCQQLSQDYLKQKPFVPLLLLGIPHWHEQNQEAGFYEDTKVFRPLRSELTSI